MWVVFRSLWGAEGRNPYKIQIFSRGAMKKCSVFPQGDHARPCSDKVSAWQSRFCADAGLFVVTALAVCGLVGWMGLRWRIPSISTPDFPSLVHPRRRKRLTTNSCARKLSGFRGKVSFSDSIEISHSAIFFSEAEHRPVIREIRERFPLKAAVVSGVPPRGGGVCDFPAPGLETLKPD